MNNEAHFDVKGSVYAFDAKPTISVNIDILFCLDVWDESVDVADVLKLDTIERAINLWSNEGDTVLTPFLGIGSEVYSAIKLNRFGIGFELKESYFNEAIKNCRGIEVTAHQPTLFG